MPVGAEIGLAVCDERLSVVPWHPVGRTCRSGISMLLQLRKVVEGVDIVNIAGVNYAHEQVSDASPVLRFIEVGIFTVIQSFE